MVFDRKVWTKCENGEWDWGETPCGRVRLVLALRAHKSTLTVLRAFVREKNDCFAV